MPEYGLLDAGFEMPLQQDEVDLSKDQTVWRVSNSGSRFLVVQVISRSLRSLSLIFPTLNLPTDPAHC